MVQDGNSELVDSVEAEQTGVPNRRNRYRYAGAVQHARLQLCELETEPLVDVGHLVQLVVVEKRHGSVVCSRWLRVGADWK